MARRLPHRLLAPAFVAGRGVGIGVPRELMHRREVAYGVQQVVQERLPEIVGALSRATTPRMRLLGRRIGMTMDVNRSRLVVGGL